MAELMPDDRPVQTDEMLLRLRNGLEPRRPHLERWICEGIRSNGRLCHHELAALVLGKGSVVQIKCPKCGQVHHRTVE